MPSDVNITSMYDDFKEENPDKEVSYNIYRLEVKKKGISFVKLGHDECEMCELPNFGACFLKNIKMLLITIVF